MADERVELRGSERRAAPDSRIIGSPDPNELIAVTLLLRRRNSRFPEPGSKTLTREEFARRYGANPDDVTPVEEFASDNDLTVVSVDLARRSMVLAGTVANMNEA